MFALSVDLQPRGGRFRLDVALGTAALERSPFANGASEFRAHRGIDPAPPCR
jgi:hypothetical protein